MSNDPSSVAGTPPSDQPLAVQVTLHSGDQLVCAHTLVLPVPGAREPLDQQLARVGGELSTVLWAALLDELHAQGLRPPGIVDEPRATHGQWQEINRLTEHMDPEELEFYGAQAGVAFPRGRLTMSGAERLVAVVRDGPRYDPFAMLSAPERAALDAGCPLGEAERAAARPHESLPGGWEVFASGGPSDDTAWADAAAQGSLGAGQEGDADGEPRDR